jgi:uncharacterized membrane protein
MSKTLQKIAIAILILLAFSPLVLRKQVSASAQDFTIQSFTADYYLSRTSEKYSRLSVDEVITAEFPDYDQNHGILRAIPKKYQGHGVNLVIDKVTDSNGKPYPYTSSTEKDNLVLKIGDASTYQHGSVTYHIGYSLRNVISYPEGTEQLNEFYWDINGDQWKQPITTVTSRLHVPKDLTGSLTGQTTCYSGASGSKEQECRISAQPMGDETIITTSGGLLSPAENISQVIGFAAGTFVQGPEIAAEQRRFITLLIAAIVGSTILPMITFIVCYRTWLKSGKDPKGRGVIIPEYVSPKGLNLFQSAYILNQQFTPMASSAGIIELAVQGYIKINEIQTKKFLSSTTDYQLEIIKDVSNLTSDYQLVLNSLFSGATVVGSKTKISDQKNTLYTTIKKVGDNLASDLATNGYFSGDPNTARKRLIGPASGMLAGGFVLLFLLPVGIGLLLSSIIAFIFAWLMPARTEKGVATREYLLGLKEYIQLAEKDRIAYLQSPQGAIKKRIDPTNHSQQVELFEDLLPYAMLFGLEKQWATQFKDLYTQPPNWYSGNMNTFNTVYLANSLSSFNNASTAAFSAPTSSSSRGFSGGGGFSGGSFGGGSFSGGGSGGSW